MALYRDGQQVWTDYSNNANDVARAILGDALEVRTVWFRGQFPQQLADVPETKRPW